MKLGTAALFAGMIGWATLCGCQKNAAPSPVATTTRPAAISTSLDACAERLHEVAGLLLHYYAINGQLPEKLGDALALAAPPELTELRSCPVSGERYVYNLDGPRVEGAEPGIIVVYDAKPVHRGSRWGICISAPREGKPMSARVVIVPESVVR